MKKIIVGIIIGMMISTTVAAVTKEYVLTPINYTIKANGQVLNDEKYPVLNYNGTTYLSLKKTASTLNADLTWDEKSKTAELSTLKGDKMETKNGYIKSNTFKIGSEKFVYVIKNNEYYLPVTALSEYLNTTPTYYIINVPGKVKIELPKDNKYAHSLVTEITGKTYINITGLGIFSELKDGVLWIE